MWAVAGAAHTTSAQATVIGKCFMFKFLEGRHDAAPAGYKQAHPDGTQQSKREKERGRPDRQGQARKNMLGGPRMKGPSDGPAGADPRPAL